MSPKQKKSSRRKSRDSGESIDKTQDRFTMSTESSSIQRPVPRSARQKHSSKAIDRRQRKRSKRKRHKSASPSTHSTSSTKVITPHSPKTRVDVSSAPTSPNREQRRILTPDSFPDLFEEKSITIICPGGAAVRCFLSFIKFLYFISYFYQLLF
ncbi:unnamed protein product [Anisakis simplex]|uniref:Transformer-like protein A n=1 Tax=Anisakis simplex TaxID=6269 RepID=A0A0M3KE28_ANISI|nr:unnamed protein product [Anisakis simplex]